MDVEKVWIKVLFKQVNVKNKNDNYKHSLEGLQGKNAGANQSWDGFLDTENSALSCPLRSLATLMTEKSCFLGLIGVEHSLK